MNLRHPLWLPWGMGGSVQAGVSRVETRAGLLGGAKCLDLYVLEAEGTRAADQLNMAGGGGGEGGASDAAQVSGPAWNGWWDHCLRQKASER